MKILIFAGPSGGHLFPALAFAEYFRKKHSGAECALVVTPRVSSFLKTSLLAAGTKVFYLPEFPFPKSFLLKGPSFLLKLIQSFLKTNDIIRQMKPDAVVAFGTFVSVPGVILARLKNIPAVVHEQNVELGRANRMLVPFAAKVAVSFPPTLKRLPRKKGVCVGNVLRPDMLEAVKKPVIRGKKTQILVLGGSQGSSALNQKIFQTFQLLTPEERAKLAVIHITGTADFPQYEHAYDGLGIENEVFPFTDEMAAFFASTDLVIARAGAGTISELLLFGLPSILIPYPHAGSHQMQNARYVAERGAARILPESSLTPESMKREMEDLLSGGSLDRMRVEAKKMAQPEAGENLVREVDRLLEVSRSQP